MTLNNTIKNIKDSTNSFFNIKRGNLINLDLLKANIKFRYEYGGVNTYFWEKELVLKHPHLDYCYYTQKRYNNWHVYIYENHIFNDVYAMKIWK